MRGYLEGKPINRMMVDGGVEVNVMPLAVFKKMGFREEELMRMNKSLSGFTRAITEAKGVLSVELKVGSKTMPTTFFIVDVKSKYNSCFGEIGFTLMGAYHLLCTSVLLSG